MILQGISQVWPFIIAALFVANVMAWCYLIVMSRRIKNGLSEHLSNVVRAFSQHRSDGELTASLDERISLFMADIADVINNPQEADKQRDLHRRLTIKDEARPYLRTHGFEVLYNVSRAWIEIYPLLGIIGTVFAIWAGLSTTGVSDSEKIAIVVQNFGDSVKSTAFGLLAAILFMVVNAVLEPGFDRLLGYAERVRELISAAKQKLSIDTSSGVRYEIDSAKT